MPDVDVTEDVPIMRTITTNLRDLLAKARQVKQTDEINPPLQLSDFEIQVINIANLQAEGTDGSTSKAKPHHAAFETAARNIFYEELAAFAEDEASFLDICNLLDILQFCADSKQCDTSLPLWLVEELLDSQTIGGCKRVFDYLESRRERMITNTFQKGKHLIVLRSCNELLRRLSKAEDAVFCGRVFMFLFQSCELGDKSSVNLRGEFHVENTTAFDAPTLKTEEMDQKDKMDVDVEEKVEEASEKIEQTSSGDMQVETTKQATEVPKIVIGDESSNQEEPSLDTDILYSMFWSLQNVFSNPTKIFATEEFDAFKKGLDATIQKFKTVTKILQTHGTTRTPKEDRQGIKRKRNGDNDELASNFNPKYLTSRDLFELEMSDLTFQRHILVQALIFIDFLLSLTPKSKKKLAELKAQKAMLYNYTLSPEDTTWAMTTRSTISTYLQDGPEGKFYYRMIDNVLSRDKNWVRWKTESCPPISLPPLPTSFYTSALNGAKRACAPRRLRTTPMGSLDLGFLTEETGPAVAEKRLQLLRDPARYTPPTTEVYLAEINNMELDMEMASTEEEKKTLSAVRASKTWRLLRLAARKRIKVLGEVNENGNLAVLDPKPKEADAAEGEEAGQQANTTSSTEDKDIAMDGEQAEDKDIAMDDVQAEPSDTAATATPAAEETTIPAIKIDAEAIPESEPEPNDVKMEDDIKAEVLEERQDITEKEEVDDTAIVDASEEGRPAVDESEAKDTIATDI